MTEIIPPTTKWAALAFNVAKAAHAGQTRRDGVTPYFNHVHKVALQFDDDLEKAVAYLHDVLEDCPHITVDILYKYGFPYTVVRTVIALTHYSSEESYENYIQKIVEYSFVPRLARRIKLADILANLLDKPTPKQRTKYLRVLPMLVESL